MNDFNASEAHKIAESQQSNEIFNILERIKTEAKDGKFKLIMYEPITVKTIEELKSRGFVVSPTDMIGIQREGIYNIIYWDEV